MTIQTVGHLPRLCGASRIAGGVYVISKVSEEGGFPIEHFLIDPPQPIWPEECGISVQGITITDVFSPGLFHAYDVVGATHYPSLADFIEEGMRLGFSRRISKNTDLSQLVRGQSKQYFIHRTAILEDPDIFYQDRLNLKWDCPLKHEHHLHPRPDVPAEMCIALAWEAASKKREERLENNSRVFSRQHPAGFSYSLAVPPTGAQTEADWGVFMWQYISHIEVVEDKLGGAHEEALDILNNSGTDLPYLLTED